MGERSQKQRDCKFIKVGVFNLQKGLIFGSFLLLVWIQWFIGVLQLEYKLYYNYLDNISYLFCIYLLNFKYYGKFIMVVISLVFLEFICIRTFDIRCYFYFIYFQIGEIRKIK